MLPGKLTRNELEEALAEIVAILENDTLTPEEQINDISDIVLDNEDEED